jgi:hypothetical protein
MMAFMAFSTSFAKASSDVDAVAVEVIAWDFGSQNESKRNLRVAAHHWRARPMKRRR